MGCNLALGIPGKIYITIRKGYKKEEEDLNILIDHFNSFFNMELYDVESNENGFVFKIKKEDVVLNIYDCLVENNDNPIEIYEEKFIQNENLPDKYKDLDLDDIIKYHSEYFNEKYYSLSDSFYSIGGYVCFAEPIWLYRNCDILYKKEKYKIIIDYFYLGSTVDKCYFEDETDVLYLLNKNKNIFKNPLSKCLTYFILGT